MSDSWVLILAALIAIGCSSADEEAPERQERAAGLPTGEGSDVPAGSEAQRPSEEPAADSEETPAAAEAFAEAEGSALNEIDSFIASSGIDTSRAAWRVDLPRPPLATFDEDHAYYWNLETSKGPISIELMPQVAPLHVTSTIYLTRLGFYDGLRFHRVIPGFMAQAGCPLGTGTGGPGYQYGSEVDPEVRHDRPGLLSMANTGRPNSDGSQFFITFVPTPHLDGRHTIFGEVVEGMDNVRELEAAGSGNGRPTELLLIEDAEIVIRTKGER